MISIFHGKVRGLGTSKSAIFLKLQVAFREHLHHFKGAKLAAFMAVALHMDKNGWSYPSLDTLERETSYNRTTLSSALTELCQMTINGHRVLLAIQRHKSDGSFEGNRYLLFPTKKEVEKYERIARRPRISSNGDEHPSMGFPYTAEPSTEKPYTAEPYTVNSPIRRTNLKKNQSKEEPNKEEPESGAGKPRRPRNPPDPLMQNPSIIVYRDTMKLTPNETQRKAISERVTDLSLWQSILETWQMHRWNPGNVAGQLDAYEAGGVKSYPNGKESQIPVALQVAAARIQARQNGDID